MPEITNLKVKLNALIAGKKKNDPQGSLRDWAAKAFTQDLCNAYAVLLTVTTTFDADGQTMQSTTWQHMCRAEAERIVRESS